METARKDSTPTAQRGAEQDAKDGDTPQPNEPPGPTADVETEESPDATRGKPAEGDHSPTPQRRRREKGHVRVPSDEAGSDNELTNDGTFSSGLSTTSDPDDSENDGSDHTDGRQSRASTKARTARDDAEFRRLVNIMKKQIDIQQRQLEMLAIVAKQPHEREKPLAVLLPRESDWCEEDYRTWRASYKPTEAALTEQRRTFLKYFKRGWNEPTSPSTIWTGFEKQLVIQTTGKYHPEHFDIVEREWIAELGDQVEEDMPSHDYPWAFTYSIYDPNITKMGVNHVFFEFMPSGNPVGSGGEFLGHWEGSGLGQSSMRTNLRNRDGQRVSRPNQLSFDDRVMGRVVFINTDAESRYLPFREVAYILFQLDRALLRSKPIRDSPRTHPERRFPSESDYASRFLLHWSSGWNKLPTTSKERTPFQTVLAFHTRGFALGERAEEPRPGLEIVREQQTLHGSKGSEPLHIHETRLSVAMISRLDSRAPMHDIIVLRDFAPFGTLHFGAIKGTGYPALQRESARAGSLSGLCVGAAMIVEALRVEAKSWPSILDAFDDLLRVEFEDVVDIDRRRDLMYDRSMAKSELYFATLQLLRIFAERIGETISSVHDFRKDVLQHMKTYSPVTLELLKQEELREMWDEHDCLSRFLSSIVEDVEKLYQGPLDRIEQKRVEVLTLRDGLFNATSVREATKSTSLAEISARQNRYILVFTITTVFYLPISVVTSFYGMHLFDPNGKAEASQSPFIITLVVLSVATYIIAGGGLYYVGIRRVGRAIRGQLEDTFENFQGNLDGISFIKDEMGPF